MTNEPNYVISAAQAFLDGCPEYKPCDTNWTILSQEIKKLVDDGQDAESVAVYQEAFEIAKSKNLLMLNRTSPPEYPLATTLEYQSPEFFESLSKEDKERFGERLGKLTPREIESLPAHLAKFFVQFEFRQSRTVPPLGEADKILDPLFLEKGYADNPRNRAILHGWLNKRELQSTLANLRSAIAATADHLELSDAALELLSADEFKKRVIDPAVKKQQAAKAKEPKRERAGPPPGFDYVSWVNGQ